MCLNLTHLSNGNDAAAAADHDNDDDISNSQKFFELL